MIPEHQAVLTALNELTDRLEADYPPAVCLPMSDRVQQLLAAIPGDHNERVPLAVGQALARMAKAMDAYRARWFTKLIVGDATRQ